MCPRQPHGGLQFREGLLLLRIVARYPTRCRVFPYYLSATSMQPVACPASAGHCDAQDTRLMHKSLAWQAAVREAYDKFIACPAFCEECGRVPAYGQFLWATASAESRAYSTQVSSPTHTTARPGITWMSCDKMPRALSKVVGL